MGNVLQVLLAGCQYFNQVSQLSSPTSGSPVVKVNIIYQSIVIYSNALSQQMFRCQRFDDLPFYK